MHEEQVHQSIKPCPICNGINYDYARTFGTLLMESLRAFAEFDIKKILALPILRETILAFPSGVILQVIQSVPSTPGLLCKNCRNYVLACPKCDSYFLSQELPSSLKIYRCPSCQIGLCICETSEEFNVLLKKNSRTQWVSAIIFGLIIVLILNVVFRLLR